MVPDPKHVLLSYAEPIYQNEDELYAIVSLVLKDQNLNVNNVEVFYCKTLRYDFLFGSLIWLHELCNLKNFHFVLKSNKLHKQHHAIHHFVSPNCNIYKNIINCIINS